MLLGLPGLVLAVGLGAPALAQEDPTRPVGRCADVTPRGATPARASIAFAYGSDALDPSSRAAIDGLVRAATTDTRLCVEVHTAVRGDAASNLTLSRARAWAVLAALRESGVPEGVAAGFGRGESEPIDLDDRNNARVIVWSWPGGAASAGMTQASAPTAPSASAQPTAQVEAVDTITARLPVDVADPEVVAALATLGATHPATFGDTYERRYGQAGVSLVVSRDGVLERVRVYGRLSDTRIGGYTIEAPAYMSEFSNTWRGPLPAALSWGAATADVVAKLGADGVCLPYGTDYNALVYPALRLTAVIQPYGNGARADCRGRLAMIEYGATSARQPAELSTASLGAIAGLGLYDDRVQDALDLLGPYARVGQPAMWVFRPQGVEMNAFDGRIRDVRVFGRIPGRPVLTGLWPWEGAAPYGLAWGASASEVARAVGHPLSCDTYERGAGGDTRIATVTLTEQALFLLDTVLYEDAAAVRARAPRGSCEGARLIGWRFSAPAE